VSNFTTGKKHVLLALFMVCATIVTGTFAGIGTSLKNAFGEDTVGVTYYTHVQKQGDQNPVSDGETSGTEGMGLRLEGIHIELTNKGNYTGSIEYRTHVQKYGWMSFVDEGELSGTQGEAKRLEAIQIKLTGDIAEDYDVYYRVHAQKFGWLDWAKNGESAGTSGYGYRLEAIQIVLVKKGEAAPGDTTTPYKHPMVRYTTHVQTFGWQNYVKDGETGGTTGKSKRLEGIKIELIDQDYEGDIEYVTHVQTYGWQDWVSNGEMSGTSGEAKRLEAIRVRLTGEMAEHYDIYYRVHAQKFGWMGWGKNGYSAGTSGYGYRLEAIQIVIVSKGETAPGSTDNAYSDKNGKEDPAIAEEETTTSGESGSDETTTKKEDETTTKKEDETTTKKEEETTTKEEETTSSEDETIHFVGKKVKAKNAEEEALYEDLFDINNKVEIDIDITDEQLKLMESDYTSGDEETYRMSTLTVKINDEVVGELEEVGVRLKGNTSRVDLYNNNNVDDRNMVHLKLNFQETFDDDVYGDDAKTWSSDTEREERKDRTFATLKALELKWNRCVDSTYVANVYANQMYRALGVYAQNTSLANVHFGGYNYGVYTMYEPVDNIFCKRYLNEEDSAGNFTKADGDLYKCKWGRYYGNSGGWSGANYTFDTLDSISVEKEGYDFIYTLKTNKKKSDLTPLKNFINAIDDEDLVTTSDYYTEEERKEIIENKLYVDNWVTYAAVSYFAGNPDDMRNNYNNHYIYFSSEGKAVIIPYDFDRCLGITTSSLDMASYSPYDDQARLAGSTNVNPLYIYTVTGRSNNYTTEYTEALKTVMNSGWIDYDKYLEYYNIAKNNYSSVAIPDSNITLYKKDLNDSSATKYNRNSMAFAESNSYNQSVEDYFDEITSSYETAMAKW